MKKIPQFKIVLENNSRTLVKTTLEERQKKLIEYVEKLTGLKYSNDYNDYLMFGKDSRKTFSVDIHGSSLRFYSEGNIGINFQPEPIPTMWGVKIDKWINEVLNNSDVNDFRRCKECLKEITATEEWDFLKRCKGCWYAKKTK